MVHGVIYSPRHPGAGCLGGPRQGQRSSFLVRLACGLGEDVGGKRERLGRLEWPQSAGAQPQDLYQLSGPTEARAVSQEQGRRGYSGQDLTFNS